ncbi:MAG TPA: glucose 1-dehydrogenase [Phototrophicaceae bacterium]|nr:glucose 1-dehydrogenase [Phototrophicaceae bacterium]
MERNLTEKIALVTGAGRGIGRGIARQLAQRGAAVALAELDRAAGEEALAEIVALGGRAIFLLTDVRDEASIEGAVAATIQAFGGLNVLVNNAGNDMHYDATRMSQREWSDALAMNLGSAWLCSKYAIPPMIARGGGVIVNIASVHATMTMYGNFPYAVTKSGLLGLTRSLALDYGDRNVRVVAVSPGYVRTRRVTDDFDAAPDPAAEEARVIALHPIKRIGTPDDVGHLVAFLVSDEAGYITGTEITIDGGLTARYPD